MKIEISSYTLLLVVVVDDDNVGLHTRVETGRNTERKRIEDQFCRVWCAHHRYRSLYIERELPACPTHALCDN